MGSLCPDHDEVAIPTSLIKNGPKQARSLLLHSRPFSSVNGIQKGSVTMRQGCSDFIQGNGYFEWDPLDPLGHP